MEIIAQCRISKLRRIRKMTKKEVHGIGCQSSHKIRRVSVRKGWTGKRNWSSGWVREKDICLCG